MLSLDNTLTSRVIACLDVSDGRVVKGVRFQNLRDSGDPVQAALRYEEQGADEIVLLDISATPQARGHQLETVARVRAQLSIPLTVGGGVRTVADSAALLASGADKVAVNSAAVRRPELISELAERFGSQATVASIDAARSTKVPNGISEPFEVRVSGGSQATGMNAIAWAKQVEALGAGEILLTSWDRDGTGEGYELSLLKAVCQAVNLPVVASGGARTAEDLGNAFQAGASAALAASLFHDGRASVLDVKRQLAASGLKVRS